MTSEPHTTIRTVTGRPDVDTLARKHRSEPDYIDRTIETVRNHRNADNCWPQWANIFADEIEDLRADVSDLAARALRWEQIADDLALATVPGIADRLTEVIGERDRFARRVAELEQERDRYAETIQWFWLKFAPGQTYADVDGKTIYELVEAKLERVAELEAALYNHGYGPRLCRCEWCAALAGDGGGA